MLRTLDAEDVSLEGDYSFVHFNLKYEENFDQDDVYIYGNFNDWQITPENKMTYNPNTGLYEATMLFKQGFYNYQYLTIDKEGTRRNYDIDGSFHLTENDYTLLVYYKPFGSRYDRVIGLGYAKSDKILK